MAINTFIVVLDTSKILSFEQLSEGKNYQFQNCKENNNLKDSIQDEEFGHFYKTRLESQGLFCVIKISQNKFLELEKIVNVLEGAIESIEWTNKDEIVVFDPINTTKDETQDAVFVTPETSTFYLSLFFVLLLGLILHDVWSGLILFSLGIITKKENAFEKPKLIYSGIFTVLIGIICNSAIGNFTITKLGEQASQYSVWISNLQLIEIFSKNYVLPLNQFLEYFNFQLIYLYFGLMLLLGLVLQLLKYFAEIILNWKIFRLQFSILRSLWICAIIAFSITGYLYFYSNFRTNFIWVPSGLFAIITILYQPSNKIKSFLFSDFGISEIIKLVLKILPFGIFALFGICTYWITKEVNLIFNTYLSEGWDFSKTILIAIASQSILSLIYCLASVWLVKITLKIVK